MSVTCTVLGQVTIIKNTLEISCHYVGAESGPKRVVLVDKKEKKIICLCDESVFGIESVLEVLYGYRSHYMDK